WQYTRLLKSRAGKSPRASGENESRPRLLRRKGLARELGGYAGFIAGGIFWRDEGAGWPIDRAEGLSPSQPPIAGGRSTAVVPDAETTAAERIISPCKTKT